MILMLSGPGQSCRYFPVLWNRESNFSLHWVAQQGLGFARLRRLDLRRENGLIRGDFRAALWYNSELIPGRIPV